MENSTPKKINIKPNIYLLTVDLTNSEYKTPRLYETWTWEGDLSVLPNKWLELIKYSNLTSEYETNKIKEFLKENYYNNDTFDKKSFFFLTHRSEVAGCMYLNKKENEYIIEFLLVNTKKHLNKGVEEGLIGHAIKRALELSEGNLISISLDLSTSNIEQSKLEEIGFKSA
jgi:hypothetical protein